MKKQLLLLLCLMLFEATRVWTGNTFTFNLGKSPGTSTPEGFFTHGDGKWNFNSKYSGGEYEGLTFSNGLKMEGTTQILFSTTEVSTVTIVQSTWSSNTIKLDDNELAVADAASGTGCRIYTVNEVPVGNHTIARGSGESGLFLIKVEYPSSDIEFEYTATFTTDAGWNDVYAYSWSGEGANLKEHLGSWPGTRMTGVNPYSISIMSFLAPEKIQFNDGGENKTPELTFVNGNAYEYNNIEYTATFTTDACWDDVYVYAWSGEGANLKEYLGSWPGTRMTGVNPYSISFMSYMTPEKIQFNNGGENKTPELTFVNGKAYKYITATPLYALREGDTFLAGTTIEVKSGDDVVAFLTYGSEGNDFLPAVSAVHDEYAGFIAMTEGNGVSGSHIDGTFYTIRPLYDGTVTVAVFLMADKQFYVEEDGTTLPDYNGITNPYNANTSFSFDVKADSDYKIYATGTKIGFFGFDYKYGDSSFYEYKEKAGEPFITYHLIDEANHLCEVAGPFSEDEVTTLAVSESVSGAVNIPEEAKGNKVVRIGAFAFYELEGITELHLPYTMEQIGYNACACCYNLKNVYIPVPEPLKFTDAYGDLLEESMGHNDAFYRVGEDVEGGATLHVAEGSGAAWNIYPWNEWFRRIVDDAPDGIISPIGEAKEGSIYNVVGQRLSKMQKGINIVGGRKVQK